MAVITKVTQDGYNKLVQEHEYLVTVRRKEVAELIKQARGFGDLSENSEYDEAKDAQGKLEARISELEAMLKNIEIVDQKNTDPDTVNIGKKVLVCFVDDDDEEEFEIVGSTESDAMANKISYESPLGKAIMGAKAGAVVSVDAPSGTFKVKVIKVR